MGDAAVFVPEATQEVTAWVARHVPGWAVMPLPAGGVDPFVRHAGGGAGYGSR
jgi:hypothetical protein